MRKRFYLLLALLAGLFLLTTGALAAEQDGDFTYTMSGGKATIIDYIGDGGDVTIPDLLDMWTVIGIGEGAFADCTSLTSIVIPNSVTTIDESAFSGCTNLASVQLPNKLTYIDYAVFEGCTGLTEITLPASMKTIGEYAFSGCSSLERINIPNGVTQIGMEAFADCTSLTSVTIPNSVTEIYSQAFQNCTNLASVTMSEGLRELGANAFSGTAVTELTIPVLLADVDSASFGGMNLQTVHFAPGTTVIQPGILTDCDTLTSVTLPDSVTIIGAEAFMNCTALESIALPEGLKNVGSSAFCNTGLTELDLPAGTTSVGTNAFATCTDLTSVSLPDSLTTIGEAAFSGCTGLKEVTLPGGTVSLGRSAFSGCTGLTSVTIPGGATPELYAFSGCTGLKEVTVEQGVTRLSANLFKGCTALERVTLPRSVTAIDATAFDTPAALTVYGYLDSYAHTFAGEKGSTFVPLDIPATGISLDKSTLALKTYQSQTLVATLTPANTTDPVEWKSSNTAVATVDENGRVYGRAGGTAVIKATAGDVSANCTVTVTQTVSSISLPGAGGYVMDALESFTLIPTISPQTATDRSVTWTSSDPTVATVDQEGRITTLKKGTTTITVRANDGGGAEAARTVTVRNTGYVAQSAEELESPHNYDNSCTDFWTYTVPGAKFLNLTFSESTDIEENFDYLDIYNGSGVKVGSYTGAQLAGQSVLSRGDTVRLQLRSDGSGNAWGFQVTSVEEIFFDISLTDGKATVTGYSGEDTDVVIPVVIAGCPVVAIGEYAFYEHMDLTSVAIPNSVSEIGNNAFDGCIGLKSVTIPNSVTSIGATAFRDCTALTSVTIPNSVTSIGENAFSSCTSLASVTLPAHISFPDDIWGPFWNCPGIIEVRLTGTGPMATHGVRNYFPWKDAVFVTLDEGITDISENAFAGCSNLNEITLPVSLKTVGNGAFNYCYNLRYLNYSGTMAQLDAIEIGENNRYLTELINLIIPAATITSQPKAVTAPAGSTVQFKVSAEPVIEGSELTYQWQWWTDPPGLFFENVMGESAESAKTPTLTVTVQDYYSYNYDKIFYRCVITDSKGRTTTSDSAKLTVGTPVPKVTITKQPVSVTAPVSTKAKFTVAAEEEGLTYQWQMRSNPSREWSDTTATGCQTPTLTVSVTAGKDGYQYRCAITDSNGSTAHSDVATLTVGAPAAPAITVTKQPVSVTAPVKAKVAFTVAAEGENLTYQWQVRSGPTKNWNEASATGSQSPSMSMSATAKKDGYQYRCAITDSNGNTVYSEIATLTIGTPAPAFAITQQPMDVTAPVKSKIFFTVAANGENLTYQWEVRSGPTKNWNEASATGSQSASMSMSVTAKKDGYQYRCVVTDGSGNTVYSDVATLTVGTPAPAFAITQQPMDVTAPVKSKIFFTVAANGENLTYQWEVRSGPTKNWNEASATGSQSASMSMSVTAKKDGYQYRCAVTDGSGNTVYSDVATLTVGTPAPAFNITQQPADVTAPLKTKAVFTVAANGENLTYQWEVRSSPTKIWGDTTATGCQTPSVTISVTAAKDGYQYRCAVTDGSGNTVYSDVATLNVG